MGPVIDDGIAGRLREALELYDLGLAIMRQNLRRQYPTDSETSIEERLLEWRLHRTDAPDGDAEGTLVPFPRPRT
jgi:hypothetical protein